MGHVKKPKPIKLELDTKGPTDFSTFGGKEVEEFFAAPVYDAYAIGIIKRKDGTRAIVRIPLNENTLEVGAAEVVAEATNQEEAQYLFKMKVIENGLF